MSDAFSAQDGELFAARGWLRLVALTGPDAKRWVEDYERRGTEAVARNISRSVSLVHQRKMDEARELLESNTCDAVEALRDAPASLRFTLDCWHSGAAAFYHYSKWDFEAVDHELRRTLVSVRGAIEQAGFLVVLAGRCVDVELQRALVARRRYRWQEMEEHSLRAWDLLEGRRPLTTLDGGSEISFANLQLWLQSLPADQVGDEGSLRKLLDPEWRQRRFAGLVAESYALSWMLIPYG